MYKKSGKRENPFSGSGNNSGYKYMPLKVNLVFFVLSFFWILFSDKLTEYLFPDTHAFALASIYKGWFYVLVVAVVQYILMKGMLARLEMSDKKLSESYSELEATHRELQKSNEELFASDEKLRKQFDELKKNNKEIKTGEDRLKRGQKIAHFGNWEMEYPWTTFWASEGAFELFGLPSDSPYIDIKTVESMIHPDDWGKVKISLDQLIQGNKESKVEFRGYRHDDAQERVLFSQSELECDNDGNPKKIRGVFRDITESKLAETKLRESHEELTALNEELLASEEELQQQFDELQENKINLEASEEKYRTLVENSHDAIYSCNTDGVIIASNKKFADFLGMTPDDIIGKNLFDLIREPDNIESTRIVISDACATGTPISNGYEVIQPNGTKRYYNAVTSPYFDRKGKPLGVTITNRDVTEIMRNEEIIRHMAYFDSLTDIPNRQLFADRLSIALNHARRTNTKVAVAFMDIDDFKRINDNLGHFAGDELLKAVSTRLVQNIRSNETAARFSGDEFTILIQGVSQKDEVLNFVERIFEIFSKSFIINNQEIDINVSMGISIFPKDGDSAEELLKHSDDAMYIAKKKGKNTYHLYESN